MKEQHEIGEGAIGVDLGGPSDGWTDPSGRSGGTAAEAATYAGAGVLELEDGRWTFRNDRATVTGTYRVAGDVLALTMDTCTANPCSPGASTEYGWSRYRDTLTLTRRPGQEFWPRLVAKPSRRDS